jgi:hypothetical protein
MRRRRLLARLGGLAAGASAATAGCLDRSGVTGATVEHVEPRRVRGSRSTVVAFDEADGEVRVTGFMFYGSSSCNRVGITESAYDQDAGHLRVVLDSVDDGGLSLPSLGCTADMAATWYRATVSVADTLPETVTVVEANGGDESTTRTVDRSEQRALCRSDHPDGSNASRRAHWTCPERYVAAEDSTGVRTPDGDEE